MHKIPQRTLGLGTILLSMIFTPYVYATTTYDITDLGTLGGTASFAFALNDEGVVYGLSRLPGDTVSRTFVYENGTMTDLNLTNPNLVSVSPATITNSGLVSTAVSIGGIVSPAIFDTHTGQTTVLGSLGGVSPQGLSGATTSVNNAGQAVGVSMVNSTTYHAFLYSSGVLTDIGPFGVNSEADSINNRGQIVGNAWDLSHTNAFLYSDGTMTNINPFGSSQSFARDINNQGQIVGGFNISDSSFIHAFLYQDGVATDIHGLGRASEALAINNSGTTVGMANVKVGTDFASDPDTGAPIEYDVYGNHAFVYKDGIMSDLNNLIRSTVNWVLDWATGINNSGQIVGVGEIDGNSRAFLLTPHNVPEPSPCILLAVGLTGLAWWRWRQAA